MKKKVLIVTTAFPPANTPDMQRVRMSLPHYHECGWEPVVLTVDPTHIESPREPELLECLPADVRVHRCGALPLRWLRIVGIRNLGLRSWLHLFFAGWRIIRSEKIDLVFFSNTQFVTFTLGRLWRLLHRVPYIIDLQDPWITNYYTGPRRRERPGGWKYAFAQLQAQFLEGWSLRRAAGVMSVSPTYIKDLVSRYPWFAQIPAEVIGFGGSETDLAKARASLNDLPSETKPVRVVSTGAAGPIMQAALRVLFDGLATMQPLPTSDTLRFEFLGTSYNPTSQPSVTPLARSAGIENLVSETTGRLGLLGALRAQLQAHALILLGSTEPSYSASKLYPYFLSGRPVLAVVLRGSVLEGQLRELSFATVVCFDETGPNTETRGQIQYFIRDALAGFPAGTAFQRNEAYFRACCLAPALTARQCALFAKACTSHTP